MLQNQGRLEEELLWVGLLFLSLPGRMRGIWGKDLPSYFLCFGVLTFPFWPPFAEKKASAVLVMLGEHFGAVALPAFWKPGPQEHHLPSQKVLTPQVKSVLNPGTSQSYDFCPVLGQMIHTSVPSWL